MHSRNVIHRDIKPENILLTENLEPKICDFGWSIQLRQKESRETFCGTYEYMAPEIFESMEYNKQVDLWSLGILLYEMFHGYSPFSGASIIAIYQKILHTSPKFDEKLHPAIKLITMGLLKLEPLERMTINELLNHKLVKDVIDFGDDKKALYYLNEVLLIKSSFNSFGTAQDTLRIFKKKDKWKSKLHFDSKRFLKQGGSKSQRKKPNINIQIEDLSDKYEEVNDRKEAVPQNHKANEKPEKSERNEVRSIDKSRHNGVDSRLTKTQIVSEKSAKIENLGLTIHQGNKNEVLTKSDQIVDDGFQNFKRNILSITDAIKRRDKHKKKSDLSDSLDVGSDKLNRNNSNMIHKIVETFEKNAEEERTSSYNHSNKLSFQNRISKMSERALDRKKSQKFSLSKKHSMNEKLKVVSVEKKKFETSRGASSSLKKSKLVKDILISQNFYKTRTDKRQVTESKGASFKEIKSFTPMMTSISLSQNKVRSPMKSIKIEVYGKSIDKKRINSLDKKQHITLGVTPNFYTGFKGTNKSKPKKILEKTSTTEYNKWILDINDTVGPDGFSSSQKRNDKLVSVYQQLSKVKVKTFAKTNRTNHDSINPSTEFNKKSQKQLSAQTQKSKNMKFLKQTCLFNIPKPIDKTKLILSKNKLKTDD